MALVSRIGIYTMTNILHSPKPQKVLHVSEELKKKNPKLHGKYIVSEKLDGWYGYIDYFPNIGFTNIHSSAQREIPSLFHIKETLPKDCGNRSFRLIFEIMIPETPFHILNGILNRKYEPAEGVEFYCHDFIYLKDFFITSDVENSAIERLRKVKKLLLEKELKNFYFHKPLAIDATFHKAREIAQEVLQDAEKEGVVLKKQDSFYTPEKRNSDLMKEKREFDKDLICLGWQKTLGEKGNENYNLLFENLGTPITVRLGKHKDISLLLADETNFVGKVCEIQAMAELPSGALREPRFYRVK